MDLLRRPRRYGQRRGRENLVESIQHSETDFQWDLALDLGDMSGGQAVPADEEGEEIVQQFGKALRKHDREQIYSLGGNHDRSGLDEPKNWWWHKWLDPLKRAQPPITESTPANRPYAG